MSNFITRKLEESKARKADAERKVEERERRKAEEEEARKVCIDVDSNKADDLKAFKDERGHVTMQSLRIGPTEDKKNIRICGYKTDIYELKRGFAQTSKQTMLKDWAREEAAGHENLIGDALEKAGLSREESI